MVVELKDQKRRWTYSEIEALDDERRVELYDGETEEMASPTLKHQSLIGTLFLWLTLWAREHDGGKVYLLPFDLYISETTVFVPDLAFASHQRLQDQRIEREDRRCLVGPPDLVVEIISPSTACNDRVRKFNEYAAFGVLHYWLVEPEIRTLQAFVLQDGCYVAEAALTDEDSFEPSLFPGLKIALNELFAD